MNLNYPYYHYPIRLQISSNFLSISERVHKSRYIGQALALLAVTVVTILTLSTMVKNITGSIRFGNSALGAHCVFTGVFCLFVQFVFHMNEDCYSTWRMYDPTDIVETCDFNVAINVSVI